MRSTKRFVGFLTLAASGLSVPQTGLAQSFCPSALTGGGAALCQFIQIHIVDQALIAFYGVAAAFICYYAARMIIAAYQDNTASEAGTTFIQVFIGFIVIAISAAFANAFSVGVNPSLLNEGFASVSVLIIAASSGVFVLMIVIAGLRMITAQGDAAAFQKWIKVLTYNAVGVVIMFIAYFIVHAVSDIDTGIIIEEMRGLALFLLTVTGFACVAALIIAGILLIISIDESLRDRAKKIVIGTLISLAFVLVVYTLLYAFIA